METIHYYDVAVEWNQDRKGSLTSKVLPSTIEVATPPEFPKGMEGIWSPEHYFLAAINGCLMTTFLAIAENSHLDFVSFYSNSIGKLEKVDGKFRISEVVLNPVLTIKDASIKEKAERVLQKSEANCLISNSIVSKIIFNPEIKLI